MLHLSTDELIERLLFTIVILVVNYLIAKLARRSIDIVLGGVKNRLSGRERAIARTRTIRGILKNIVEVALFIISLLIILSRWEINTVPILTGAGLIGLAVSFGSQSFIKDLFAGFFIITEDIFDVGDRIKIGDYEGTVQHISLRLTVLRDKKDNLIYIPNSEVTKVIRYTTSTKI